MIEFLKKLEERVNSEREKMVGKAILYAENSEPSNRNGYMTHKYVCSTLKEIVSEYKEELSKILSKQEELRQQDEKEQSNVQELTDKAPVSKSTRLKDMNITLGSNLKKKSSSSKEESKTSDTPKKSAPKRGRPKKGGESNK